MKAKILIIAVILIFVIFGCGVGGSINFNFKSRQKSYKSGDYSESIKVDGIKRTYLIHMPKGYSKSSSYPLVLAFHGGGGSGKKFSKQSDFSAYANKEGFIVAYPDAAVKHNWNDGRGTTDAEKAGIDDVKFVRELINHLKSRLSIDTSRIYATGPSNGGIFSYRLGCEMADELAAIAPVIGNVAEPIAQKCSPKDTVSLLSINGLDDPAVPFEGGDCCSLKYGSFGVGDGGRLISTEGSIKMFAESNDCSNIPKNETLAVLVDDGTKVEKISYSQCSGDNEVVYYVVHGMGHTWPPKPAQAPRISGKTSQNIDATKVIWEFFKAHTKYAKSNTLNNQHQSNNRSDKSAIFQTVKVSSGSLLPQGETEIVTYNNKNVVVAWMDGSPAYQSKMTLRTAYSTDGGITFAPDSKVDPELILGDPTMAIDQKGKVYLGALRKDSPFTYRDLAVVLFNSLDFGKSWRWRSPVVINDDNIFNDRDWLTVDKLNRIHMVYSPRIQLPDGNFDRPIFYQVSEYLTNRFNSSRIMVNPKSARPPDTAGGSARGIAVTEDGHIVIGVQEIPKENKEQHGGGIFKAPGYVFISEDNGGSFYPVPFTTTNTLIASSRQDEFSEQEYFPKLGFQPYPRIKAHRNNIYAIWIGEAAGSTHSIYMAVMQEGKNSFNPPVAIINSNTQSLTLPTLTIDKFGAIHVFWLGRKSNGLWSLFYSSSKDDGKTFSTPYQITAIEFPMEQWPGDFNSATANDEKVFVAWAAAGGSEKGVYVSSANIK